jgi:hypothetical protein
LSKRLLLVFMIDALGHRIVRDSGFFGDLQAPDGPIPPVCGYSTACIPSLLTGRRPVEHGHWAMYRHDPERSVFRPYQPLIQLGSGLLGRDWWTRRLVQRAVARRVGGYFSLYEIPLRLLPQFDLCEQRDIFAAGAFPGLGTPFDLARDLGLPHRVWSWRTPEEQNRRELAQALATNESAMLFFYSPKLDAVMHARGTRSDEAHAALADFARLVHESCRAAERAGREVRLLVFGDHGMADTRAVHDLLSPVQALGRRVPEELLYFIDSTMGRFWFPDPAARAPIEELLSSQAGGRVLGPAELEELGILFPDGHYGELCYLAEEGVVLAPSFMGRTAPQAMHGYHPGGVDAATILLANFDHRPVRSIRDIGPLLMDELRALAGRPDGEGA